MIAARLTYAQDKLGWEVISWRLYLTCLATSFFVLIEPAPTDLLFVLAAFALVLSGVRPVKVIGPIDAIGAAVYIWFSALSLYFVVHSMGFALRALGIEIYLVMLYLMTAYFAKTGGDKAFKTILLMLLVAGTIASLLGVLAYWHLIPNSEIFFRDRFMQRISSTFKDPNVLGPFLVPSILLCYWMAIAEPRVRLIATAIGSVVVLCLVLTFSRGAMIHTAFTLFVFTCALLAYRKTSVATLIGIIGLFFVATVILFVFQNAIMEAVSSSFLGSRLTVQYYDESRFTHIFASIGHIMDHPFGIGPNQSRSVYGYEAHNTFIVIALNNGLLAGIGLLIIYVGAVVRCMQKVAAGQDGWLKYAFVLAVLAGLTILMNVVSAAHWRHMWVILGLAYGNYTSNHFFVPSSKSRKVK